MSERAIVDALTTSQPRDTASAVSALLEVVRTTLGARVAVAGHASDAAESSRSSMAERLGGDLPLTHMLVETVRRLGRGVSIEDTRIHPLVRSVPIARGVRILSCIASPIHDQAGQIVGALCAFDDVPRWWSRDQEQLLGQLALAVGQLLSTASGKTSRIDADRAATHDIAKRAASTPADELLRSAPDGMLVLEPDWTIAWCNRALSSLLDTNEPLLTGANARQIIAPSLDAATQSAWQRALRERVPTTFTFHHRPSDRWLSGRAWPMAHRLAIVLRDVTREREVDDAHLRRVDEAGHRRTLDAVGQLAGGVAHDFNNLLTVIRANAELLQHTHAGADVSVELLEIHRASARATDITRQLLAFGQQQLLEPAVISLNHVVGTLEPTLRAMLSNTVRLETSLTLEDASVLVDTAQLQLAVRQLVSNARDAMVDGGVLQLMTDVRLLTSATPATPGAVPAGRWITLAVRDTGHGIAAEHLNRVFEPFFTTRDVRSGVGLGLASAHGIIAQSGGVLTVESEPERGSTFTVWLPALDPAPARRDVHAPNVPVRVR